MPRQDDPWSEIPDDEPRQELIRQSAVNPALRPADPDLAGMLQAIHQTQIDIQAQAERQERRDSASGSIRRALLLSVVGTAAAIVVGDIAGWANQFVIWVWRAAAKASTGWLH